MSINKYKNLWNVLPTLTKVFAYLTPWLTIRLKHTHLVPKTKHLLIDFFHTYHAVCLVFADKRKYNVNSLSGFKLLLSEISKKCFPKLSGFCASLSFYASVSA